MRLAHPAWLGVTAAALAACHDPTSPTSVAGTYVLQAIDGKALPVETYASSNAWYVTADTLTLNADGTWADRAYGSDAGACRGTWTVDANGVTLQHTSGAAGLNQWCGFGQLGAAPVEGPTLTLTSKSQSYGATGPGNEKAVWTIVWVFRRQ